MSGERDRPPELTAVRVMALLPPLRIEVDLYLPAAAGRAAVLYSGAANPPDAADLYKLLQRGILSVAVPRAQMKHLRAQWSCLADVVGLSPALRLEAAREFAKEDFAQAWRERSAGALVAHAAEFTERVVDICGTREEMVAALASLASHDRDTFAHVTNVCAYGVMLARTTGIDDPADLLRIGQACLLHDIGKRSIHRDILQKPGALTEDERRTINDHPRLGFEELSRWPNLTMAQWLVAYQHHERLDGSGYPVGLVGDEITPWAQLCSVVDVFDALTSRRKYRKQASAAEVMEHLRANVGTQFSGNFVHAWSDLLAGETVGV